MGTYNKAIITESGEALLARALAGEATIEFSYAKTSSYIYPEGTDFKKLTELQGIKQVVVPSNIQISNNTLVSIRSLFRNDEITETYYIQNIGIYATDGEEEILFSVSQAVKPDEMPVYNGVAPSSFIYNVQLTVLQADQLSVVINPAGTATTADILELEQKKIDADGGDISETQIALAEASSESFPVPAAGDTAKGFLGKVKKFVEDFRNWYTGVCLIGSIVNNCTSDNTDKPLAAKQGQVLLGEVNKKAPISHASTATTYGLGTASNYGHVKLSDSYTSSGGAASAGVAASSKAVYDAYTVLNTKSQSVSSDLTKRGTIYTLQLNSITPTDLNEHIISDSVHIPAGNYLIVLNAIARSACSDRVDLNAMYNDNAFIQGRIPNTNGTHMNICMNNALYLPESDITFRLKRLATDGEVVFFGGSLLLVYLK